jgi:CelD/BcsL family acetyltransferase involved in cellulose biosynthesis
VSEHALTTELAGAEEIAPAWERLAVAASKPVAAAAWVLAWWRHVAPSDTSARVVVLRDRGELIGVAPFHLASNRRVVAEYRLMASDLGVCMEPLALPGREWELAGAIAAELSGTSPRAASVGFGPMPIASPWVAALRESWQGPVRSLVRRTRIEPGPLVQLLEPDYERWFASLGSKLRRDLRRRERIFEEAGGTARWADATTLRADAESFARLHGSRWEGRDRSPLADLGARLPDWLEDLGGALIGEGRFRLCVLEVEGEPVCVDLSLSAGEEVAGVDGGWDQSYARMAPAKLAVLCVIADAYAKGMRRVGLGGGGLADEVRLANGDDPVAWSTVIPPSPMAPLAYGRLLAVLLGNHARELGGGALPRPSLERLKALARRRG